MVYYICPLFVIKPRIRLRDLSCWSRGTLYPQKLALTSPTSGGRSRTHTTEFVSFFSLCASWCAFSWLNYLLHTLQENWFSPLRTLCLFKSLCPLNDLLHILQENWFSPLCTLCLFKSLYPLNDLLHILQENCYSSLCIIVQYKTVIICMPTNFMEQSSWESNPVMEPPHSFCNLVVH
jgi:hypothetical protein